MESQYWTYKPGLIPDIFDSFLTAILPYLSKSTKKRISCVFSGIHFPFMFDQYGKVPSYSWDESPLLLKEICKNVESYTGEKYDYVLVHLYESGEASIQYHNDSEALNSSIASVSLGATRKFRLKHYQRKTGWDAEYHLGNGDLIWMHGPSGDRLGCQSLYLHSIPVEKTVKEPRINLTFRQFEK